MAFLIAFIGCIMSPVGTYIARPHRTVEFVMQIYTTDTSPEAASVHQELIRRSAPSQRVTQAFRLSNQMARLSKAAIRRRHPDLTEQEVGLHFIELHYGAELANAVRHHQSGASHETGSTE